MNSGKRSVVGVEAVAFGFVLAVEAMRATLALPPAPVTRPLITVRGEARDTDHAGQCGDGPRWRAEGWAGAEEAAGRLRVGSRHGGEGEGRDGGYDEERVYVPKAHRMMS